MKHKKRELLRAKGYFGAAAKAAPGLVGMLFSLIVLGLMFSALQGLEAFALRAAITAVGLVAVLSLFLLDGAAAGFRDAKQSDFCMCIARDGMTPEAEKLSRCYHPAKPVITAGIVFAVPVLLGLLIAANAGKTHPTNELGWIDWIRLTARLPVLIWLNLFKDAGKSIAVIDRLTPVFCMTYPLMYMAGYTLGPEVLRREKKKMRRANRRAAQKASRSKLAEQLTHAGANVHYGQAQSAQRAEKKNELI